MSKDGTINKNSAFYRCQKRQLSITRASFLAFIFFLLMLCMLLSMCVWLKLCGYGDSMPFALLTVAYVVMTSFLGYVYFRNKSDRTRIFEKYSRLSEEERLYMDSELLSCTSCGNLVLGGKYFYFAERFLDYVPYSDIVWIFEKITNVSVLSGTRPEDIPRNIRFSPVIFFDTNGRQHRLHISSENDIMKTDAAVDAQYVIEHVKKKNPTVIVGYSKERYKMAKRDFEHFIYEEKYQ